jgi:small subunit ribosomal protein S2|tara:strand:+ start:891 stop:1772 length:882 start_codon:yes stop_codon:yes gene_type:complete
MATSKKNQIISKKLEGPTDDSLEKQKIGNEPEKDEQTILTSLEDYIKTASYLGTKVITPTMRKYIYRRRLDGLAILNTILVDKKLREGIDFIKRYKPDEWTLICKREAGWRAAKMFSELTDVRVYTKKYPAGILTNSELDNFIETEMIMICDPWLDKNALTDAKNIRIPVIGICDTNNHTADIDVVIIGNNKSNKSLGLFFWLMAREYMKAHGINKELPSLEEFVGEELVLEEPKKKRLSREKKEKDLKSGEGAIEEKMRALAEKADEEAREEMGRSAEGETIQVGKKVEEGV